MNRYEEEHEITDREKRAWQDSKKPRQIEREALSAKQVIQFLKLVAQLATPTVFERKLGLRQSDVEFYKKKFDVESQDDARRLYKRLEIELLEGREESIIAETGRAREAEEVANQRLKELEQRRVAERAAKPVEKLDGNKVRQDDADRQRRFAEEQKANEAAALSKSEPWTLPLEGSDADKRGITERYRRDIEHCGMNFCVNKYHVTPLQLKAEAARLGLRINWDRVKR